MNVTIAIGEEKRSINEDYESWISEQIINRRKAGETVRVTIQIDGDINLTFTCEDKPSGGDGGNRKYSTSQQEIINLWRKHGLNECPINPGGVISFLKRLEKLI